MTSAIYLTGSTIEVSELVGQLPEPDWRSLAMSRLRRYGLRVLNPLELLTFSEVNFQSGPERRVRRALDLIDQCDAVLANLMKPSYGTAMEIFYAHRRGKMVTVVGSQPFSPWVLSHSQAHFEDMHRALDYLIGEPPQIEPISWALQYEALLAEHYEQFPPDGEADYQFLGGELPVLVVAPHATAFFREGEFQEPDAFSGSTAALLNRLSGCHSLISFYCCAADWCWHLQTPMRRAFADIISAGKIGLVIFLLGSAWHETRGLQVLAEGPDPSASEDLAGRLRLLLSALEPVSSPEQSPPLPLVHFASQQLAVPVLTIKMHKRYRMPRLQPELFQQMVQLLSQYIAEVGFELVRNQG